MALPTHARCALPDVRVDFALLSLRRAPAWCVPCSAPAVCATPLGLVETSLSPCAELATGAQIACAAALTRGYMAQACWQWSL
eukprot:3169187-Rhodomonas_salina.2